MKRFVLWNLAFTGINLGVGLLAGCFVTYLYAALRGDLLPQGSTALDGPRSLWVGYNFRYYLPQFLAVASALGVAVGQVQFITWLQQQNRS